ncbi:MAG: enoyl-[acyl-carrier-protein] reductase FabL [Candidatus Promineifilaceae bacterium]
MLQQQGRVALVTGSGRGIGRAIALHLADQGADVVVNFFRNRAPAEETARQIEGRGRRVLVAKAHVGDLEQLAGLYQAVEKEFGRLDILVHNAASGFNRPAQRQTARGWEWTMNINARSLLFGAQHAARLMAINGGGAIVAITSLGSTRVMPDYVAVGASKAALESLVRYLGVELAPQGIVVNAVAPGLVQTDALSHFAYFDKLPQEQFNRAIARTPRGRLCRPEDVAEVVAFLCTPAAAMICGQVIVMDGGFSLLADA